MQLAHPPSSGQARRTPARQRQWSRDQKEGAIAGNAGGAGRCPKSPPAEPGSTKSGWLRRAQCSRSHHRKWSLDSSFLRTCRCCKHRSGTALPRSTSAHRRAWSCRSWVCHQRRRSYLPHSLCSCCRRFRRLRSWCCRSGPRASNPRNRCCLCTCRKIHRFWRTDCCSSGTAHLRLSHCPRLPVRRFHRSCTLDWLRLDRLGLHSHRQIHRCRSCTFRWRYRKRGSVLCTSRRWSMSTGYTAQRGDLRRRSGRLADSGRYT